MFQKLLITGRKLGAMLVNWQSHEKKDTGSALSCPLSLPHNPSRSGGGGLIVDGLKSAAVLQPLWNIAVSIALHDDLS